MLQKIFRSLWNFMKLGSNELVSEEKMFAKIRAQHLKKTKQRERRLKVQKKISNAWKNGKKEILVIMMSLNFFMGIQSRIKLDEQFRGIQDNVSTVKTETANLRTEMANLRTEMANVKTEMANVKTEIWKVKTEIERDTGIDGTVKRVKEVVLTIFVTGVSVKIGNVIVKYFINQYNTLSNETKILKEENVALKKELQNYGSQETYTVSPNIMSMEKSETVPTEKPGNNFPDESFKIGLVNFIAEQVDFFDPTSEMTVSVKERDLTFQQKVQMVLRKFQEQAKQKNYAWGEKIRQFLTVKVGGITISLAYDFNFSTGSSGLSEAIKDRPETTKPKSNQVSESFVKPKEKKLYGTKFQTLGGNATYPLNLDDYESAEQAKVFYSSKFIGGSSFRFVAPTLPLIPIIGEEFVEIDANGDERPITDSEMDEIIKDHKKETQREKQNDSDEKAKNDSDNSLISLSTNNSQKFYEDDSIFNQLIQENRSKEYYESMKSKSSPSLIRIRLADGDHIVISSGPDRRVDHISKEKLG